MGDFLALLGCDNRISFCLILTLLLFVSCSIPVKAVSKSAIIERNEIRDTVALLKQSERRWIEVDLSEQRLIAWTGKNRVML